MDLKFIARPYAKAIFAYAIETNTLDFCAKWLANAAALVKHTELIKLLSNPEVKTEEVIALFDELLDTSKTSPAFNFITVLAENKRLLALPFILEAFNKLLAEYEKEVDAEVVSALTLTTEQRANIATALEKRLNRKVNLHCVLDNTILGGAIIRIDDLVIDGSGRGRLNQLREHLKGK